jgi:tetratricopeptide (TPR) repeat protein
MSLFRRGYFQRAHAYFQAALDRIDPGAQPALYFDINYNLAQALQHRGEYRQAIKVFEALRIADVRHAIRYEHGIAASNYKLGDYQTAIRQFTRVTEKYRQQKKDFLYYEC